MTLIVQAANMHAGGGRTLLQTALQGVPETQPCLLLADGRLDPSIVPPHVRVETFPPTLSGRLAAERRLSHLAEDNDVVLCLGNLPPLIGCHGRVIVYLGNRYLCDKRPGRGFSIFQRTRIEIERVWLRRRLRPSMRLFVQTPSMQVAVRRSLGVQAELVPFFDPRVMRGAGATRATGPVRFLYPASGEPHKNHASLLEAWRLLRGAGATCELHLTVDAQSPTAALIATAVADGVPVVNHGSLTSGDMVALYARCTGLVFPSDFESFGLPLLEAAAAGLTIVAAERDYVRDVVAPAETFDPTSPISIARAVRRAIGEGEAPTPALMPRDFIAAVTGGRQATRDVRRRSRAAP